MNKQLTKLLTLKSAFFAVLVTMGFSSSTYAFQSTCPVGHLKNLNYQLLLTSNTGTLKRINIPRKSIYIDKTYGELEFSYDVRPILKTKAFRKGIAKYTLTATDKLKTSREIEVLTGLLQLHNPKANLAKNPDPSFAPRSDVVFTVDEDGYVSSEIDDDVFSKGDRIKMPFRPNRENRKAMDLIFVEMYCLDEQPNFDDFDESEILNLEDFDF